MRHVLDAWTNFYLTVGSAAGALTGLQFVVVALVADTHNARGFTSSSSVFATPTVVHFSYVLVLSAVIAAPWPGPVAPMAVIGGGGVAGFVYSLLTARRAGRQEHYQPVLEDWLFHVYLPGAAYLTMAMAALLARVQFEGALFAIAGCALVLLIVGIHNAWDTVTYIVALQTQKPEPETPEREKPERHLKRDRERHR